MTNNLPAASVATQPAARQQHDTKAKTPPAATAAGTTSQSQFAGLDSRLAKTLPGRTAALQPTADANRAQPTQQTSSNANAAANAFADRQIVFSTGRAAAFRGTLAKTGGGGSGGTVRVSVANEAIAAVAAAGLGAITRVTAAATGAGTSAAQKPLWEHLVGSAVVNFAVGARWTLLCSLDGTVRVLDVWTGVPALPVVQLPTAAVQCCFVSTACFRRADFQPIMKFS